MLKDLMEFELFNISSVKYFIIFKSNCETMIQFIKKSIFLTLFFALHYSQACGFTYKWGHPSPQGNIIYNIAFKDGLTGWAVTGCGLMLKTTDEGENWEITREADSLCTDLYDIIITSQGTLVVSGDQGTIMRSTDEGVSWQTQNFSDAGRLYDLALIPGGGISAAGQNGVVLVSFDDGTSWMNKGPGGTGYARHHYWKTALEGYVVGYGIFHRTVDGGNTWTQINTPPTFGLNEVYFVNENTGYAVEDFGYWKTIDAGENWVHVSQFTGIDYRFRTLPQDEQHWFAVSNIEGGVLWETIDAGENWNIKFDSNSGGFFCLVKNGDRLLFGSDIGDIFYTNDGGANVNNAVQNLAVFPSAPVNIIGKRPDGTLFANNQPNSGVNNGSFFRSDDGGSSWYIPSQTPDLRWVYDIQFSDNQHGVLGSYSDIRYTNDGGNTWNTSSLPANFRLVNFALASQSRYFAGTYSTLPTGGGNVYKSTDQGATWQAVGGGLPENLLYVTCLAFASENTGYVSCLINNLPAIYKTIDAGDSWALINQSGLSGYISHMVWLDDNTGIAAAPNNGSGIFRTTDGGLHWIKVSETGARHLTGIYDNQIAAVEPGDIIFQESLDGGINWSPYSPPFSSTNAGAQGSVQSIQITENGYILGGIANRLMVAVRDVATGLGENQSSLSARESQQNITLSPNPVNEKTVIRFNLDTGSHVTLQLFDAEGQLVHAFIRRTMQQGSHELPFNMAKIMQNLRTGIYYLTLQTDKVFNSVKVILVE
jgi:photosystem II stability/assembly factor-like uncharacterized protein